VGSKTLQALDDTAITRQIMKTAGILKITKTLVPRFPLLLVGLVVGRK
jgi:hypothetical protein